MFASKKTLIGMVHIGACPGAPHHKNSVKEIVAQAVKEAKILLDGGFDALIFENMHDRPYCLKGAGPEVVATMTAVGTRIRELTDRPLGVQILGAANEEALAVALACEAQFLRAEGFVFSHIGNTGFLSEAAAGSLLRYRKNLGAENIAIIADIKKKHSSHAITVDLTIADVAREAVYCGADGLVVTGLSTGLETSPEDCKQVKEKVQVPVIVGSGTTPQNIHQLWPYADAFIVGSYIKEEGQWFNPPDPKRIADLMNSVSQLKPQKKQAF